MDVASARQEWAAGERRLRNADPTARVVLERVIKQIVEDLRRQTGAAFMVAELAEHYDRRGTDWCVDLAMSLAPGIPAAWDAATVGDTAYHRHQRAAMDYAGGRVVASDND